MKIFETSPFFRNYFPIRTPENLAINLDVFNATLNFQLTYLDILDIASVDFLNHKISSKNLSV